MILEQHLGKYVWFLDGIYDNSCGILGHSDNVKDRLCFLVNVYEFICLPALIYFCIFLMILRITVRCSWHLKNFTYAWAMLEKIFLKRKKSNYEHKNFETCVIYGLTPFS